MAPIDGAIQEFKEHTQKRQIFESGWLIDWRTHLGSQGGVSHVEEQLSGRLGGVNLELIQELGSLLASKLEALHAARGEGRAMRKR